MSEKETKDEKDFMAEGPAGAEDVGEETEESIANDELDVDQLILNQHEKISRLEKQLEEIRDSNLRKVAELENYKKRMNRERTQMIESAKISAIESFLPINDDLQRTLQALEESDGEITGILEGIKLIGNKFEEALKRYNVERINQTGVPFDVDLHDALMRQKTEDEDTGSDIVLQVLESGYRMGDRTIRHAKVIVSE